MVFLVLIFPHRWSSIFWLVGILIMCEESSPYNLRLVMEFLPPSVKCFPTFRNVWAAKVPTPCLQQTLRRIGRIFQVFLWVQRYDFDQMVISFVFSLLALSFPFVRFIIVLAICIMILLSLITLPIGITRLQPLS